MTDITTLIADLREEATRLSGRSLDRGCVDSGIAATLADRAADALEASQAREAELRAVVARVTSDRQFVIGFNAGWDEAISQNLRFPTMLRKMWSGSEVQKWIDDQMASARSRP